VRCTLTYFAFDFATTIMVRCTYSLLALANNPIIPYFFKNQILFAMKKNLSLLFCCLSAMLFCNSATAQNYHPLLLNSSWEVTQYNMTTPPTAFTIPQGRDTIIGAYVYKKFNNTTVLRENVATRKVYKRSGNLDIILFDFSLVQGQHITLGNGADYVVDTVSYINVVGGTRKKIELSPSIRPPYYAEVWIEGVGNEELPLTARYEWGTDPAFVTRCSYQNGNIIYNQGIALNGVATNIHIFPNPAQSDFNVNYTDFQNKQIIITDILGRMQTQQFLQNETTNINTTDLPNGIYFLAIYENKELLGSQKIVVQHE
jgi:Secretion system C-terminal sorting domain